MTEAVIQPMKQDKIYKFINIILNLRLVKIHLKAVVHLLEVTSLQRIHFEPDHIDT